VIGIAQLARTVSIDFKFPEHINHGLSALTRSTKEAALLLSGSSFRSMDDTGNTPKPQALAPQSLSSMLSPMNISQYTGMGSPSAVSFSQERVNKFDATIVQMRNAGQEQTVRSPPPPIVSIPLPRE
jgi:hypothetical protein